MICIQLNIKCYIILLKTLENWLNMKNMEESISIVEKYGGIQ